jgi:hypothetical protein
VDQPGDPDLFIQANDGGANVTHNGGETWSTQFNQPTTELYQVEVDDQYPYWLYAGQQDNGTTIAVPSRAPYRVQNIVALAHGNRRLRNRPGGAQARRCQHVYANCKGRFGVFDKRTGHGARLLRRRRQHVRPQPARPALPLPARGADPRIAPRPGHGLHGLAVRAPHRDDGVTWETISPDLTAFEADKQVISGSPITRDITGEEFYSTLYSLRESPVAPG